MRLYGHLSGKRVQLVEESLLGMGGEGRVCVVQGAPELAAKIFDDAGRASREAKLRVMVANPPVTLGQSGHASIAWPTDLLCCEHTGEVVGYLMPRVRKARVIDDYYNPRARLQHCPLFHYEYLLVVARNLAAAAHSLHRRGVVIGDIKQSNILVTANALVTLVDTDSFQVRDEVTGRLYRCPVGTPEYTPPELQGESTSPILTPEHDLFGLAVLIFQLLMEGSHPFGGVYTGEDDPPPIGERIRQGWFPYGEGINTASDPAGSFRRQQEYASRLAKPFVPSRKALPLSVLPPEIRGLFLRCFEDGREDPSRRPTADAWRLALDAARAGLTRCAENTQHRYSGHLHSCPWCERKHTVLQGHDPFPATGEADFGPVSDPAPIFAAPAAHSAHAAGVVPQTPSSRPIAPMRLTAVGIASVIGLLMFASRPMNRTQEIEWTGNKPFTYTSPPSLYQISPISPVPAAADLSPLNCALSADGRTVVVVGRQVEGKGDEDRFYPVRAMDAVTGHKLYEYDLAPADGDRPVLYGISGNGDTIALSNTAGSVLLLDRWSNHKDILSLPAINSGRAAAFSPDGNRIAVTAGESEHLVYLFDVHSKSQIQTFKGEYGERVDCVRFSPDGTKIVVATSGSASPGETGSKLYCWDTATGEIVWKRVDVPFASSLSISADGSILTTSNTGVAAWNMADGTAGVSFPDPDVTRLLAFSPQGSRLATCSDASVRFYTVTLSGPSNNLNFSVPRVFSGAFSRDGKRFVTLSAIQGVDVWDLRSGRSQTKIPASSLAR